jgi:hypothetical protein
MATEVGTLKIKVEVDQSELEAVKKKLEGILNLIDARTKDVNGGAIKALENRVANLEAWLKALYGVEVRPLPNSDPWKFAEPFIKVPPFPGKSTQPTPITEMEAHALVGEYLIRGWWRMPDFAGFAYALNKRFGVKQ